MTIYTNVNEFCSAVMAPSDPSVISVETRKPRSPSPTKHLQHNPPSPAPTEFKVGSWGKRETQKRAIRSAMAEKGVYILSLWGDKDKISPSRKNAMESIRVGDTLRMPDYWGGMEYVGSVETLPIPLTRETLMTEYLDVWKAAWGEETPDKRGDIYFRIFKVSWVRTQLTDKTRKDLKKLVKNGGKCTRQCGTIIKLI
jgi:hypothetical protein